jgi:mercuric ion transport protein
MPGCCRPAAPLRRGFFVRRRLGEHRCRVFPIGRSVVNLRSWAWRLDASILAEVAGTLQVAIVSEGRLLKVGVIGAAVAAICCFTPALVVLLGVLGLSRLAGVLDYVLLPALLMFVGLIIFALIRRSRAAAERAGAR